jgi:hypothetical protein
VIAKVAELPERWNRAAECSRDIGQSYDIGAAETAEQCIEDLRAALSTTPEPAKPEPTAGARSIDSIGRPVHCAQCHAPLHSYHKMSCTYGRKGGYSRIVLRAKPVPPEPAKPAPAADGDDAARRGQHLLGRDRGFDMRSLTVPAEVAKPATAAAASTCRCGAGCTSDDDVPLPAWASDDEPATAPATGADELARLRALLKRWEAFHDAGGELMSIEESERFLAELERGETWVAASKLRELAEEWHKPADRRRFTDDKTRGGFELGRDECADELLALANEAAADGEG